MEDVNKLWDKIKEKLKEDKTININIEYWENNMVAMYYTNNIVSYPTGKPIEGIVVISRDGLVFKASKDLKYVAIDSIHSCICS